MSLRTITLDDRRQLFAQYGSDCGQCRHFDDETLSCPAFDEIPLNILSGDEKHRKVRKGQKKNIVFEQKKSK